MHYSLPSSSVHGILQARILEWVAILISRGSSWPRDWTRVPFIAGRFFTIWATKRLCLDLETWSWWICLQGSNGDADVESRLVGAAGEGGGGAHWENSLETCQSARHNLLCDAGDSDPVPCDNLKGWDGVGGRFRRGGDKCIPMVIHADARQRLTQYYE